MDSKNDEEAGGLSVYRAIKSIPSWVTVFLRLVIKTERRSVPY